VRGVGRNNPVIQVSGSGDLYQCSDSGDRRFQIQDTLNVERLLLNRLVVGNEEEEGIQEDS